MYYKIKTEFDRLLSKIIQFFKMGKKLSDCEVILENIADTDKEKEMIKSGYEYIEDVCNHRKELIEKDLDPNLWFEEKLEKAITTLIPDATEAEKDEILSEIEGAQKQHIEMLVKLSEDDIKDYKSCIPHENK